VSFKRGLASRMLGPLGTTHLRVGRVLLVVLFSAGIQIITQAVLARSLTKAEVGVVSLLLGAASLLSTFSLLGQDASTVRFLSRVGAAGYDAASHVKRVLLLVVPLGVVVAVGGAKFYSLGGVVLIAAIILVVSENVITVLTSIMRAAHRYELAVIGTRLPLLALGVVLLVLYGVHAVSLNATVAIAIAAFAATALALIARLPHFVPRGSEPVPLTVMREGPIFFGLSISFTVMVTIDQLIVGKMMRYDDLAVYATIFAVMKAFDFLFQATAYVLMPRVNAMRTISLSRLNLSMAAAAVALGAVYLAFGSDVVHLLYGGRYDQGAYLIVPFVVAGILKLFYALPTSIIGGRLPMKALRQFLWFNLAGMVLNVGLDIVLIRELGLLGAAVATAIAWAVRLAGGYLVVLMNRSHLAPIPAEVVEM
jgi:O-antigen/teichoic acid export membrane protein